jgi:hypothetical protein
MRFRGLLVPAFCVVFAAACDESAGTRLQEEASPRVPVALPETPAEKIGAMPEREGTAPALPLATSNQRLTLTLSFDLADDPTVPVEGLSATLALPPGATVATESGSNRVAAHALRAGTAVPGTHVITGTFDPSRREVRVALAATPTTSWSGAFAQLDVDASPGPGVADRLRELNDPLPAFKAVGVDEESRNTAVLTGHVRPRLEVASHE